jgi:hypothetical protein
MANAIAFPTRRVGLALVALCAALPALADTEFRVRRVQRNDLPLGVGQCEIRLQVDNEVEVQVRRDRVFIHTIAGREGRDDGSECNAPLPERPQGFAFDVAERRNEIVLLSEPSRRNDYSAIVRIRDSSGGEGRYRFRLSWRLTGGDDFDDDRPGRGRGRDLRPDPPRMPEPPRRPPVFEWRGEMDFRGPGRGVSDHSAYGSHRLSDARVEIRRDGRVSVTIQTDLPQPLILNGSVVGREGPRLRAEVVTLDGRMRGPLFISVNGRNDEVNRLEFDGADGRQRLRVRWDRR